MSGRFAVAPFLALLAILPLLFSSLTIECGMVKRQRCETLVPKKTWSAGCPADLSTHAENVGRGCIGDRAACLSARYRAQCQASRQLKNTGGEKIVRFTTTFSPTCYNLKSLFVALCFGHGNSPSKHRSRQVFRPSGRRPFKIQSREILLRVHRWGTPARRCRPGCRAGAERAGLGSAACVISGEGRYGGMLLPVPAKQAKIKTSGGHQP